MVDDFFVVLDDFLVVLFVDSSSFTGSSSLMISFVAGTDFFMVVVLGVTVFLTVVVLGVIVGVVGFFILLDGDFFVVVVTVGFVFF